MILRATFRNILSFDQETSISFVAGTDDSHPRHVLKAESTDDIPVLRTGLIYGANASGKSNFIKGVNFLRSMALGASPDIRMKPFKRHAGKDNLSKIELEFKIGLHYYAYGLEFTIQEIKEEWLYETNNTTDTKIFSRISDETSVTYDFPSVSDSNEEGMFLNFLAHATPLHTTFLSEYIERNGKGLDVLKEVREWFRHSLHIIFSNTRYRQIAIKGERDKNFKNATKALLQHFNTGVTDIRTYNVKSPEDTDLPRKIVEDILSEGKKNVKVMVTSSSGDEVYFFTFDKEGRVKVSKQKTVHGSGDSETVFEMYEESDGTIRLMDLIPMLIDIKDNGSVYLIDELDRSMHPMMSYEIVRTYLDTMPEDSDSQIIFSTHESNLLTMDLLRPDEIWFVEKDNEGASHFTSLAEYKPRNDIRKGYLQGRYGAIPFFGCPIKLRWHESKTEFSKA